MSEPERATDGIQGVGEAAPLSPHRAFVVQFRAEVGRESANFAGRVEHMTSGRATRFQSPEELLAFFTQVLGDTGRYG